MREKLGKRPRPACSGHEIVAEVIEVGKDVTTRQVGDIIGVGPLDDSCGHCHQCSHEKSHLCTDMLMMERQNNYFRFGGYSTMVQAKAEFTVKIPKDANLKLIAPLLCAGTTVYTPLKKFVKSGDTVGVMGIGGLGHLAIQYANKMGCKVIGFTRSESKVEFIKQLGAHEVIIVDQEMENFKPIIGTINCMINTTPICDPKTFTNYLMTLAPQGSMVQVGIPLGAPDIPVNFFPLLTNELCVRGSSLGTIKDTQEAVDFAIENGVECMVEEFGFMDFPKAFDRMENGKPMFRVVVNVGDYAKEHGF